MDAQWDSPTRDDGFRTPAPDSVAASSSSENGTVLRRTRPARLDIPVSNSLTFGFSLYCKRGRREYMEEDNLCGEHKLVTKFYFSTFFFWKIEFCLAGSDFSVFLRTGVVASLKLSFWIWLSGSESSDWRIWRICVFFGGVLDGFVKLWICRLHMENSG